MVVTASEFKAKCLALFDRVRDRGETIVITKRGKVVARVLPPADTDEKPWRRVRGTATWNGDPFAPAIDEADIDALK
ncbi:MAG: prevent-host-death protein [Acidobacteria bacterium]|nr:MAG: prevent-host-death protein [Acidobacteriota bacterium]